jgi:hypothetical protein
LENGNWKVETGKLKLENGNWKMETRKRQLPHENLRRFLAPGFGSQAPPAENLAESRTLGTPVSSFGFPVSTF